MKKKQTLFGDVLETVTKYFLILVIVVVLFVLFSGIRVVESGNEALVLRFGKLTGESYEEQVHGPGLLFAFPYFVDEVIIVPTGSVFEQPVTTHYTGDGKELSGIEGGYLITGDQNVAVVSASVKYTISDPVKYTLNVADAPALINATVSSAMVNEAAGMDVDDLLTTKKDAYASAVLQFAMEKLHKADAGVTITSIELTQVAVPEEVRYSFESLNAANVQAETINTRAEITATNIKLEAETKKASLKNQAQVEKGNSISTAMMQVAEINGVYEDMEKQRAYIAKTYAEAHGHSEEYDAEEHPLCDACEAIYAVWERDLYNTLYLQKFTAVIEKLGKLYVTDGDSKIFINP